MQVDLDHIEEDAEDNTVNLDIITPAHAQFYGQRGRTFDALQHLLRVILWKKGLSEYINLDLNSAKKTQYDKVREQARQAAEKITNDKDHGDLPHMNPTFRRIAHLTIKNEFPDLQTESIEEHGWKFVRISKKDKS